MQSASRDPTSKYQKQTSGDMEASPQCGYPSVFDGEPERFRSMQQATMSYDPHRLLLEAAEEMSFDLPEFQSVERIKTGITEIALAFLILAGLAAIGGLSL